MDNVIKSKFYDVVLSWLNFKSDAKQIAVLRRVRKAGVGIIAMFLGGGWKVDVVSRSASTRDGLPDACAKALAALGKPIDTSGLKTYATLPEASWKAIDVVVETVTEDLELKRRLFAEM